MAAWLAYLKSRLLLPEAPKGEEPAAADLAAALAERLRRLEQIRTAAEKLVNRPRMGRDMFMRGAPEGVSITKHSTYQASLFDLLTAYSSQRQKFALSRVTLKQRVVWSLAEARAAIERLAGHEIEWNVMDEILAGYFLTPELRRTVRASTFSASLELVREGRIELRQDRPFAPIWVRGGPNARGQAA
jgi:segregation and condensation protein A